MIDRSNDETAGDESPMERGARIYEVPSGVEPSVGIVEAVADVAEESPTTLPPLQETVDVDAMDALLSGRSADDSIVLTLDFADHVVVIDGGGTITVGR